VVYFSGLKYPLNVVLVSESSCCCRCRNFRLMWKPNQMLTTKSWLTSTRKLRNGRY